MTILEMTTEISTSANALYRFHLDVQNARIVTPKFIVLRFQHLPEKMTIGSTFTVEINQFGFWMPWDIIVEQMIPDTLMVDRQFERGPFRYWRHEHRFTPVAGKTLLTDRIEYVLPFGIVGMIIDRLFFQFIQKQLFAYRHKKTVEYFLSR